MVALQNGLYLPPPLSVPPSSPDNSGWCTGDSQFYHICGNKHGTMWDINIIGDRKYTVPGRGCQGLPSYKHDTVDQLCLEYSFKNGCRCLIIIDPSVILNPGFAPNTVSRYNLSQNICLPLLRKQVDM